YRSDSNRRPGAGEPGQDLFTGDDTVGVGDCEPRAGPAELFEFAVPGPDGGIDGGEHFGVEGAVTGSEGGGRRVECAFADEAVADFGYRAALAHRHRHGVDLAALLGGRPAAGTAPVVPCGEETGRDGRRVDHQIAEQV